MADHKVMVLIPEELYSRIRVASKLEGRSVARELSNYIVDTWEEPPRAKKLLSNSSAAMSNSVAATKQLPSNSSTPTSNSAVGTKLVPTNSVVTTKPAKVWPEPGASTGKRPRGAIEPDLKAQPGQYGYEFQFLDSFDWCQSCNSDMNMCRCPLASEFLPEKRVTLLTRKP